MPKHKPPQIVLKGDKAGAAKWLPFAYKLLGKMPRALMRKTYLPVPGVRILVEKVRRLHRVTIEVEGFEYLALRNNDTVLNGRFSRALPSNFPVRRELNSDAGLAIWPMITRLASSALYAWGYVERGSDVSLISSIVNRKAGFASAFEIPTPTATGGVGASMTADESSRNYLFHMGEQAFGLRFFRDDTHTEPTLLRTLDNGATFDFVALPNPFSNQQSSTGYMLQGTEVDALWGLDHGHDGDVADTELFTLFSADKGDTWTTYVWADSISTLYSGLTSTIVNKHLYLPIFSASASFLQMDGAIGLVGFVVTDDNGLPDVQGHWRLFVSSDGGQTFSARDTIPCAPIVGGKTDMVVADYVGYFRTPIVLPDNKFLAIEPDDLGVGVYLSDVGGFTFTRVASFPVSTTGEFGLPEAATVRGEFKVLVTAKQGTDVVVYKNTDSTYTTWEIAGIVGPDEDADFWNPSVGAKFQYPFSQVLRFRDGL